MRKKLFKFIRKIGKIEKGCLLPKWLIIIHYILFPIKSYLCVNSSFNYDIASDSLIINGINYSFEMFENFKKMNEKEEFIISQKEKRIIWKRRKNV